LGDKYGIKEDVEDELRTLIKLWDRKSMSGLVMPKTLNQFHRWLKQYREPFATIFKLATTAISLSVSSAGCERSFIAMKRIKAYNKTSMSNSRLSDLAVLNVASDRTMNLDEVVPRFAASTRRIRLF